MYEYDAMGHLIWEREKNPGDDEIFGTEDDENGACKEFRYDEKNRKISQVAYSFCIAAHSAYHYEYDDGNKLIKQYYSRYLENMPGDLDANKGPDGIYGSKDDVIDSYSVYVYDNGKEVLSQSFDAGPDGIMNTTDDIPSWWTVLQQ